MNYDRESLLDVSRSALNELRDDISKLNSKIKEIVDLRFNYDVELKDIYQRVSVLKVRIDDAQKEIWRNNDVIKFNVSKLKSLRPSCKEIKLDEDGKTYEVITDPDKAKREHCEAEIARTEAINERLQSKVDEAKAELNSCEEQKIWLENAIVELDNMKSICSNESYSIEAEYKDFEHQVHDAKNILDSIQNIQYDVSHEYSIWDNNYYKAQWVDGQVDEQTIGRVIDTFNRNTMNMVSDFELFLKYMQGINDWDDDLRNHFTIIVNNIAKIFDKYIFSSVKSNMTQLQKYRDLIEQYNRIVSSSRS